MILEIVLLFLAIFFVSRFFKQKGNLPPGPMGIPFFGTLPYITIDKCIEARKKYGNIFMTNLGSFHALYLCDFKTAKDAFSRPEFADRPPSSSMRFFEGERSDGKAKGVISSNGSHWFHNRRFLLRHLRDLGMGKSKIEGIVMREIEDLVEDFKGLTKEPPSKLPFSINIAVLNIIWQLVASHRYNFKDEQVERFMGNFNELQKVMIYIAIPEFFPVIEYIIPKALLNYLIGVPNLNRVCKQFEDMVQPFIDEHLKTLDPSNPRDLIDDYLVEMKKKSDDYAHFSFSDLTRVIFDLFFAGNDTTSNMTRWFLIYMARFHEIQEKIQKEIDRVVPRDTLPGLQHRNELAYLDATINEVQRHSSMIAMGLFRGTTTDVKLDGYDIPKGTAVFSLAALSHKDPTYFKDPDVFDPSRFIDENGKYFPTCDGFQAFGLGKRQCLGEQFARMELYLITAALMQNFTFEPPEGEGQMSIEPDVAPVGHLPRKSQKFWIKCRN